MVLAWAGPSRAPTKQPSYRSASRTGSRAERRAAGVISLALGPAGAHRGGRAGARFRQRRDPEPQKAPPLERVPLSLQGLCQDIGRVAALIDLLGLGLALGSGLLHDGQLGRKVLHFSGHLVRGGPVKDREGNQVELGGSPRALPQLSRLNAVGDRLLDRGRGHD